MELDFRKQRILNAIVSDYIATAEPVGSHVLVERYALGVKSATIRNEMAEMSERGFLRQPHTSAGRVPSDQGYRFYVNRLMPLPVLHDGEAARIQTAVMSAASELDNILRRTCQLLAQMTSLPAVATSPDADDTELRQVFLSPAGGDKVLLVLLFSTGRTENRLLVNASLSAADALHLVNALNEQFSGASLADISTTQDLPVPVSLRAHSTLWARLIAEVVQAVRGVQNEKPMYVEGEQTALGQPEFRDVERLSQFLSTLQERAAMLEMLSGAFGSSHPSAVQIRIGAELGRPDLAEYSLVSSSYFIGQKERGSIGVLGPTRMDYARASAAVDLMARTMSELLTRLSIAP